MRRITFLISFAILLIAVFFIPLVLSTSLGKPLFIKAFERRLHGKVEIGSLHLSWLGPQKFKNVRLASPEIVGSIESFEIQTPFWSLSNFNATFSIANGSFSFPNYDGSRIDDVNGQIEKNQIELTGTTREGDAAGQFSIKGAVFSKDHFDITAAATNLPTGAIDRFLHAEGKVFQILGPTVDFKGAANLHKRKGVLDLDVTSPNLQTSIRAHLSEHEVTLKEPLRADFQLTPDLAEAFLSEVNPLFITGVRAKNPIRLVISPEKFSFPIPFTLHKLSVGNAILDMGQIVCTNGPSLSSVMGLLKANPFANLKQMNAWFTPVSFMIGNGFLQAGRLDALFDDSIHICIWGNIELSRSSLDMYIGIPADTLKQSFGISHLPENFVLKVPLRGTPQNPDLIKGPAAAKIAAMAAAQQIPKKGGFFGGLVKAFTQATENKDIPPANHPFPWEK